MRRVRKPLRVGVSTLLGALLVSGSLLGGCGDDFDKQGDVAPDDAADDAMIDATDAGEADAGKTDIQIDAGPPDTGATDSGQSDTTPPPQPCTADKDCTLPAAYKGCAVARCLKAGDKSLCAPVFLADGGLCDDSDDCTAEARCKAGVCTATTESTCGCKADADCAQHEDGDPCNGTLSCDQTASPTRCVLSTPKSEQCSKDEAAACKVGVCDKKDGTCKSADAADDTVCDDGDKCTADDRCAGGKCAGKTAVCPCTSNAECATAEDGNLCNGTLYCDKSEFPSSCKLSPATVVTCTGLNDTACQANTCDPKTGKCAMKKRADKTACSDGDKCTGGDKCYGGTCVGGANVCLCKSTADCAQFEDGNACTGTLFCDITAAQPRCEVNPASTVKCADSEDPCVAIKCDGNTGACLPQEVTGTTKCSDGDACTGGDHCDGGKCVSQTDICPCKTDADCADKSNDKCLGPMFCDTSKPTFQCRFNPAKARSVPPTRTLSACATCARPRPASAP